MAPADLQLSTSEVLRAFNRAQIYLFLGAAITTIGLLAASFSLLRRRLDPLLLWFALFAILYGARMWMTNQMFEPLASYSPAFERARVAIGFLVPVPAFFFLRALDLLTRVGRAVAYAVTPVSLSVACAALLLGPLHILHTINNIVVTTALIVLVFSLVSIRFQTADRTLIRSGLFVFVAAALYENIGEIFAHPYNVEPFSFVVLLSCLGIVAARRTLAQEQQLTVIRKELEIAQRIQLSILPAPFPSSASLCVAARYVPMTAVAGDFYDFLVADDQHAGLLIADVSGHGVPAALIASMVKLAATSQRNHVADPPALLAGMNAALCGNTQSQFVTAAYVYLDTAAQQLSYAAAAHPPMLLLRRGQVTSVVENGLMLAAFDFATYTAVSLALEPGDRLLLYTDGILEASNLAAEEFGPDRLARLLEDTAHSSHVAAADDIMAAVQRWAATQEDDLTVLVCDYTA